MTILIELFLRSCQTRFITYVEKDNQFFNYHNYEDIKKMKDKNKIYKELKNRNIKKYKAQKIWRNIGLIQ